MDETRPAFPVSWIVWGAIFSSQLVYVGLALSGILRGSPSGGPAILLPVFAVVAVGSAVGAHLLWMRGLVQGRRDADSFAIEVPPPDPAALPAGVAPLLVVAWSLDESIAVYGLVLAILGFSTASWAPFAAAAFLLTILHAPRTAG